MEKRFNNSLLNDLDDYLKELRPKKYDFVTEGIEAMNDISKLGLSDRQLKKFNRVSWIELIIKNLRKTSRDEKMSKSDIHQLIPI